MDTLKLEHLQLEKLNFLLSEIWERDPFYTHKWCQAGVTAHQLASLEDLALFPLTTRSELLEDQSGSPPLGSNLTCPFYDLKRIHRSSGTTHAPLFWADTPQSWAWLMRCSRALYLMAGIEAGDRIFFTLPFGSSSGPWIMYEGACRLGCCCWTGGEAALKEQLCSMETFAPTVLVGTPVHLRSLGMAFEVTGADPRSLGVTELILTGACAPPDLRLQLEHLWAAQCFDRYGLTEAGSVACECTSHPCGMHLLETEYLAEVLDPKTTERVAEGNPGELVLTTLGRFAQPIVRYRTGDLVRLVRAHHCACGREEALLVGGVSRIGSGSRLAVRGTQTFTLS